MHIRIALRKSPLTVAIALLPIPITIVALNVAGMRIWELRFDPAHMNGVREQRYFDIVAGRGSAQQQGEAR